MKTTASIFVLLSTLIWTGCTNKVRTETISLPNGGEVRIRQVLPIAVGDGMRVLMLTYVTDLNIEDIDSVQREVDTIWPWYQTVAEQKGYDTAGVSAASVVNEKFMRNETNNYNFIYEKKNGIWKQLMRPIGFEAQQ